MNEQKLEWPDRCLDMEWEHPEDMWMPPEIPDTQLILGLPKLQSPRWLVWAKQNGHDVIMIYDETGNLLFSLAPAVYFEDEAG